MFWRVFWRVLRGVFWEVFNRKAKEINRRQTIEILGGSAPGLFKIVYFDEKAKLEEARLRDVSNFLVDFVRE